jgi:hypothetical protein
MDAKYFKFDTPDLLDGIVSYWKCDDASGNLVDIHSDNDAVATSILAYQQSTITNGTYSVQFNGSTSYATVPTTDFDSLENISISLWFNPLAVGTAYQRLIHKADSTGTNTSFIIVLTSGARMAGGFIHSGTWFYNVTNFGFFSQSGTSNGTWYHLVLTYSSQDKLRLYRNGVSCLDAYDVGTWSSGTGNNFNIGRRAGDPTAYFNGYLDEIGIWNRALSGAEVLQLYNSGNGLAYSSF